MLMRLALALVCLVRPGMVVAQEVEALLGTWRTVQHDALVKVVDCGDATPCATLKWVAKDIAGGHSQDVRNVSKNLRDRPLIGVPIFGGFQGAGDGWEGGWIYNPEYGRAYRARLKLISTRELRVTGCLGLICRSQTWRRVP